ncbi:MAG: hypothetical protein ACKOW8_14380, partial [Flavobacteriales bacterium]
MKKVWAYICFFAWVFAACNSEQSSSIVHSNSGKIIKCNPTIIRSDTLPQPEPIPMEFDQLETYKLELGEPGEPLVNEYPLGPGVVHELIQDRVVKRYPGDGTTEECVSLELTGTKRKL